MVESQKAVAKKMKKQGQSEAKVKGGDEEMKVASKKKGEKAEVDKTGDHPPPKRAATPWSIYNTEYLKKLVEEGMKVTEIFKINSENFKKLSEEQLKPYQEAAEKDL